MTEEAFGLSEELRDLLTQDEPLIENRREHSLSNADLLTIAAIVKRVAPASQCSVGITPEEAFVIKRMLWWANKAFALVGFLVISAIVGTIIAIFSKGFWGWLGAGKEIVVKPHG
jgi:hypothetical protein